MFRTAAALAAIIAASPALAQSTEASGLPDPNDQSNTFTIAAGGAYIPDYEGSNDYKFTPFALVEMFLVGAQMQRNLIWCLMPTKAPVATL